MITAAKKFLLNKGVTNAPSVKLGDELSKEKNVVKCVYDFSVGGGDVGDIELKDMDGKSVVLPDNAIVTHAFAHILTTCTSGGAATVAVKSEGAGDIMAATAVASLTAGAFIDGVPANTAATVKLMSADRTVKATIAVAALTAGKLNVFITYVLSD